MKKYLLLCLIPIGSILHSQTTQNSTPSAQQVEAAQSKPMETTSGVLMIDPKARVSDYLKAFDLLKKEKTAPKIFLELRSGQKITNLVEMTALPDNTLLIIRSNTAQGVKIDILPIEELASIGHQ